MNSIQRDIFVKKSQEKFCIMLVSDLHIDSPLFCLSTFRKMVRRAKELSDTGTLFFLVLGDLEDADNRKMRNAKITTAMSQDRMDDWKQESERHKKAMFYPDGTITKLSELFQHGTVIGAVAGNHHKLYPEGINSAQYVANYFKYPYLGTEDGGIRLMFRFPSVRGCAKYDIYLYHGSGQSAIADGGKIRAMLNGIGGMVDVDLVARGHSHDLETKPKTRLVMDNSVPPKWVEKKTYFISNGSTLRSYVPRHESYAELKNMKPTSLSWGEVELTAISSHERYIQTRVMYS